MRHYADLSALLSGLRPPMTEKTLEKVLSPVLIDIWLRDYGRGSDDCDAFETKVDTFHYLFDVANSRLIAAWGLSKGKDESPRSIIKTRMQGHPLTNIVDGMRYHRGHTIPHTMGGRTDINLVSQLGVINSGPFQELERLAVSTPGSVYFTYWIYPDNSTQRPSGVEQGCLIGGSEPNINSFRN